MEAVKPNSDVRSRGTWSQLVDVWFAIGHFENPEDNITFCRESNYWANLFAQIGGAKDMYSVIEYFKLQKHQK